MAGRPRRRARLNSAREQNMYSIWIYSGADYDETALAGAAWEVVWADLSYEKELLPEILRQYDPVKDEVSYANSDISYSASAGRTAEKPGFGWRDGVHHNYADDPEHQAEVAAARKRFGPSGMQKLASTNPRSRWNPKKKWGSPQVTVEEPRDLREQVSWRAVIEGTRPDLETELTWRGPTKEPFLSMWADGWRKFKARHDWSGRPLVIHFWQSPSGERSHLKIKDSPLERGAVPLKNPWH